MLAVVYELNQEVKTDLYHSQYGSFNFELALKDFDYGEIKKLNKDGIYMANSNGKSFVKTPSDKQWTNVLLDHNIQVCFFFRFNILQLKF